MPETGQLAVAGKLLSFATRASAEPFRGGNADHKGYSYLELTVYFWPLTSTV